MLLLPLLRLLPLLPSLVAAGATAIDYDAAIDAAKDIQTAVREKHFLKPFFLSPSGVE